MNNTNALELARARLRLERDGMLVERGEGDVVYHVRKADGLLAARVSKDTAHPMLALPDTWKAELYEDDGIRTYAHYFGLSAADALVQTACILTDAGIPERL